MQRSNAFIRGAVIDVVPVFDVAGGVVVHAVAGNRSQYAAISRELPVEVICRHVLRRFSSGHCYVADLDAIVGHRPQVELWERLVHIAAVWLDAGVRTAATLVDLKLPENMIPVVGSETAVELDGLLEASATSELIFSLDLRQGSPISADSAWQGLSSIEFARQLVRRGASKLILLDLAAVGVGHGVPTLPLCRQLKQEFPELFLITGGGVRSPDCLLQARDAGVDALLVASALHDGRITPEDISRVTGGKG